MDFEQIHGAILQADLDDIVLLHFKHPRSVIVLDSPAGEKELEGGDGDADVCLVELLQPSHFLRHLVVKMNLTEARANRFGALSKHLQLDDVLFTLPSVPQSC